MVIVQIDENKWTWGCRDGDGDTYKTKEEAAKDARKWLEQQLQALEQQLNNVELLFDSDFENGRKYGKAALEMEEIAAKLK